MAGKLIVLYGINNLGKSTQARILVEKLLAKNITAAYLKYPLYDLVPSGELLNNYLRKGNTFGLSAREFQIVQILNKTQYDPTLRSRLAADEWIVAEDYTNTGIAWGMGAGVDKTFMERLNSHLRNEDLGILFKGKRFMEAQEKNHMHETNDELTNKVAEAFEALGKLHGWESVNANETIESIAAKIWDIVQKKFKL